MLRLYTIKFHPYTNSTEALAQTSTLLQYITTSIQHRMFSSKFPVKNKRVLVCGGSQGAGLEFAKQLFTKGAHVIISARSVAKLSNAVSEINSLRKHEDQVFDFVAGDMGSYEGCEHVFNDSVQKFGGELPDILICCVGSSIPKLFVELSGEELTRGISTNYSASLFMTHVSMKSFAQDTKSPRTPRNIVIFSSVLAHFSFIGYAQYAPLKAALKNLVDSVADEAALYNVKVTGVYPGNFMSEGFMEEQITKPAITKKIEGPSEPISVEKCCEKVIRQLENGREVVVTDAIGWVLSSGALRRDFAWDWPASAIVGFILLLIGPIARFVIGRDVKAMKREDKREGGK